MTHFNSVTEASISYIMMNESILLEDRIQYLKDNSKPLSTDHDTLASHKDTPSIIQHFADNGDPTKNKKYTQYLVGLYRNGKIRQEDAPALKETLGHFDKYRSQFSPEDKQLTTKNYPSISDVRAKVSPHIGKAVTNQEKRDEMKENLDQPGKHELKFEDDKIKIFELKDKNASQSIYGSNSDPKPGACPTEWCTARQTPSNMFDHYNKEGPLHVIHRKEDGAVFQYHTASQQFMDKDDNDIKKEDFMSIAPSFHKALKKNPGLVRTNNPEDDI